MVLVNGSIYGRILRNSTIPRSRFPITRLTTQLPLNTEEIVVISIYASLFIFGVSANIYCIVALSRIFSGSKSSRRRGKSTASSFIHVNSNALSTFRCLLALNITDLVLIMLAPFHILKTYSRSWDLGLISCKTFLSVECFARLMSSLLLTYLISHRYFSVFKPHLTLQRVSKIIYNFISITLGAVNCFICCLIFRYATTIIIYSLTSKHERKLCNVDMDGNHFSFVMLMLTSGFCIPGTLMLIISAVFIYRLKKRQAQFNRAVEYSRTAIRSMLCAVLLYFICWTPFWTMNVSVAIDGGFLTQRLPLVVFKVIHSLPYLHSAINPIIYTLLNRAFQRNYTMIVSTTRRHEESVKQESSNKIEPMRVSADHQSLQNIYDIIGDMDGSTWL